MKDRGYKLRPMNAEIQLSEYDDAVKLLFVREGSNMGTAVDLTHDDLRALFQTLEEYYETHADERIVDDMSKYAGGTACRVINLAEGDKIICADDWRIIESIEFADDVATITLEGSEGFASREIKQHVSLPIVKK